MPALPSDARRRAMRHPVPLVASLLVVVTGAGVRIGPDVRCQEGVFKCGTAARTTLGVVGFLYVLLSFRRFPSISCTDYGSNPMSHHAVRRLIVDRCRRTPQQARTSAQPLEASFTSTGKWGWWPL
jgi:hypothetical protein